MFHNPQMTLKRILLVMSEKLKSGSQLCPNSLGQFEKYAYLRTLALGGGKLKLVCCGMRDVASHATRIIAH